MGLTASVPVAVVLVATLVAAATDLWKFRVQNVLTLPLVLSGVIYHTAVSGLAGFTDSMLGFMVGFGILFVFYAMGGMGGGDVKLMGGIGAWLGVPLTVLLFLASSVVAGIYALVVVVTTGKTRQTWVHMQILWHRITAVGRHLGADDRVESEVNRSDRRGRVIPFAAMIAVGFVGILVWALVLAGH